MNRTQKTSRRPPCHQDLLFYWTQWYIDLYDLLIQNVLSLFERSPLLQQSQLCQIQTWSTSIFLFRVSIYAIIYYQYREPSKEVNESEHPVSIPAVGVCPRRRPEGRQRWSSGLGLASSSSSSSPSFSSSCTVAASTASVNLRPALQQSYRVKPGNCRIERQILEIQKLRN